MRPTVTDVASSVVWVLGTRLRRAKRLNRKCTGFKARKRHASRKRTDRRTDRHRPRNDSHLYLGNIVNEDVKEMGLDWKDAQSVPNGGLSSPNVPTDQGGNESK